MKPVATVFALGFVLSTFTGCYMSRVVAPGRAGTKHSDTGFSFFWGITKTTHGAVECPYGLQEVTHYWPWYSYILQGITLGIVSPIKREYVCAEPANGNIHIHLSRASNTIKTKS